MAKHVMVVIALVIGGSCCVFADQTVKDVEKEIVSAWKQHRSVTADINVIVTRGNEQNVLSKQSGTFELLKQDEGLQVRMDITGEPVAPGQPAGHMLVVINGKHVYLLQEMGAQRMARKADMDPKMTGDPSMILEALHENFDLKLKPEETVRGEAAYVIEATPKAAANAPAGMSVEFRFSKEHGAILDMTQTSAQTGTVQKTIFKDFKYDVKIDPERFEFKLPEGVELVDLSSDARKS